MIDPIFKDTNYLLDTVKNYKEILVTEDGVEQAKLLSSKYEEDHDSGFLYKKTVYDKY